MQHQHFRSCRNQLSKTRANLGNINKCFLTMKFNIQFLESGINTCSSQAKVHYTGNQDVIGHNKLQFLVLYSAKLKKLLVWLFFKLFMQLSIDSTTADGQTVKHKEMYSKPLISIVEMISTQQCEQSMFIRQIRQLLVHKFLASLRILRCDSASQFRSNPTVCNLLAAAVRSVSGRWLTPQSPQRSITVLDARPQSLWIQFT